MTNKCDHTIGVFPEWGNTIGIITMKSTKSMRISDLWSGDSIYFDYCPDCGAKIDWEQIKERLTNVR